MMKAASYIEAFRPPYSWIAGAHCGGVSRYIMEEGNVGVHTLLNTHNRTGDFSARQSNSYVGPSLSNPALRRLRATMSNAWSRYDHD